MRVHHLVGCAVLSVAVASAASAGIVFQYHGSLDGPYGPGTEVISPETGIFVELGAGKYDVLVGATRPILSVEGAYGVQRNYANYDENGNFIDSNSTDSYYLMSFAPSGSLFKATFEIPQGETIGTPGVTPYQLVDYQFLPGSVVTYIQNSGPINYTVLVTTVPEPASWAMLMTILLCRGAACRVRGRPSTAKDGPAAAVIVVRRRNILS